jgi:hypothetical protein
MNPALNQLVEERWRELPLDLKEVLTASELNAQLHNIVATLNLGEGALEKLRNEILLVLFVFEPITHLQKNIRQSLGISEEYAASIFLQLEMLSLYGVKDYLYEIAKDAEFVSIHEVLDSLETSLPDADSSLKERLELRPDGTAAPKAPLQGANQGEVQPLTREQLLSALSAKRTMAGDIEAMKRNQGAPPSSGNPPTSIPPPPPPTR